MHFDIGRDKSIRALEAAMASDRTLFVSTQMDENVLLPKFDDIYETGTLVKVKQMLKINGDAVRVLVAGISRAVFREAVPNERFMECRAETIYEEVDADSMTVTASCPVASAAIVSSAMRTLVLNDCFIFL